MNKKNLPISILYLLISFASVNGLLFTPALPDIVNFFEISVNESQLTLTTFLAGYALGQLIYGPLANRLGRKKALTIGIIIQIISSLVCASSETFANFTLLIAARFVLGIGSGCGLKITITMINEYYSAQKASQTTSYLMSAFAIMPGLGVAVGGILNTYFGWTSCFYAGAFYGLIILWLTSMLPETQLKTNPNALKIHYLLKAYSLEFSNIKVVLGGFLVGLCSCYIYVFAAVSPFIAINLEGMSSEKYGYANLLAMGGMLLGSLLSAKLIKKYSLLLTLKSGILITLGGVLLMTGLILGKYSILLSLFFSMLVINIGQVMILANSTTIAMNIAKDKAHGSSVINFIAVALATVAVQGLEPINITVWTSPLIFALISFSIIAIFPVFKKTS